MHKYHGRVLLTTTGVCAVNCRYCFRRHFPYQANNPGRAGLKHICDYIAQDTSITEVILSGGDPLLASDVVLRELIEQLEQILICILYVSIHVFPWFSRTNRFELTFIIKKVKLNKVIVLHCNHAQELDDSVRPVLHELRRIDCHLLNQTVLLAGINDNAHVLADLSQTLFSFGVLPYYLHVLDKVKGAAHFDLPFNTVQGIYQQLQNLLPGYLLPRLVREEPGKSSKTLLI